MKPNRNSLLKKSSILFFTIAIFVACNSDEKEPSQKTNSTPSPASRQIGEKTDHANPGKVRIVTPIYFGGSSFKRFIDNPGNQNLIQPDHLMSANEMFNLVLPYAERVKNSSSSVSRYSPRLNTETFLLYIDKKVIDSVYASAGIKADALLGIFAVDMQSDAESESLADHQTIILLPCDKNGLALPLGSSGVHGAQRWPGAETVSRIIGNGDNLSDSLQSYFKRLKIM